VIVVTNEALAARRRRQAALCSLGGFVVLVAGLVVNLLGARGGGADRSYVLYAYLALIAGSILSWVGMALSDRWALPPRPEQALEGALKGAGKGFRLYNWALPADHVLATPWGLVVAMVFNHDGPVVVHGRHWRDMRPIWRRAFSLGRRPVRDPSRLLALETRALSDALLTHDEGLGQVPIEGIAVFTRPGMALSVTEPNLPAVRADELREWLRAEGKRTAQSPTDRRRLERALETLSAERLARDKGREKRKPARAK
jgi:hypothetical protein